MDRQLEKKFKEFSPQFVKGKDGSRAYVILEMATFSTMVEKLTTVDEKRKESHDRLKKIFKKTQSLPHSKKITEKDIQNEIDIYRSGK